MNPTRALRKEGSCRGRPSLRPPPSTVGWTRQASLHPRHHRLRLPTQRNCEDRTRLGGLTQEIELAVRRCQISISTRFRHSPLINQLMILLKFRNGQGSASRIRAYASDERVDPLENVTALPFGKVLRHTAEPGQVPERIREVSERRNPPVGGTAYVLTQP